MRARENDLRAARAVLHFQHHGAQAVMHFETFARHLLVVGHDALGLHIQAQGHTLHGVAGLHHAADDLAHLPLEIFQL